MNLFETKGNLTCELDEESRENLNLSSDEESVVPIRFLSFIFLVKIGKMKERGFLYGLKLQCIILSDSSWS